MTKYTNFSDGSLLSPDQQAKIEKYLNRARGTLEAIYDACPDDNLDFDQHRVAFQYAITYTIIYLEEDEMVQTAFEQHVTALLDSFDPSKIVYSQ